jgi:hypothetical protein
VTITGLAVPVALEPSLLYQTVLPPGAFPAPGDAVRLDTSGADYPPFSITSHAVEPLASPAGKGIVIARDRPVVVSWPAPVRPDLSHVRIVVHAGILTGAAAHLECDVADTGSLTIPATLVGSLLDRGVGGFSRVTVTRRAVASTSVGPGCVELVVMSERSEPVVVEGVTSCDDVRFLCLPGQTCRANSTCQ